ncbi:ricin B-like lectin R40G3 [Coffea eugenioides]|uniref:ricin B-like lectin R40G3 n=1 Tax=Coffea eugenioides TaxID=49369 RepID=UPI000F60774E|nr:ricin B-like lectin R40G3 [Coffea eugenioides]
MDFPRGHNTHHHHHPHRPGPEEEVYPPAARPHPPPYYENEPPPPPPPVVHHPHPAPYYANEPPPPPQVTHVHHGGGAGGPHPPDFRNDPPPPPPPVVEHVSHHSFHPHMPSVFHHHTHHSKIADKPSVRVYTKAEPNYSLTIRDGKVILAPSNTSDPFQHWIKDEKYSTKVKDEEGFPSFALVNKATGQAMKHSIGATQPVQLIPYNPDVLDESILWTESRDLGDTFRTIRMVNNIRLNVDAFNGDKNHGGVHDGTVIVLWEWKKGDNQRWKIVRY